MPRKKKKFSLPQVSIIGEPSQNPSTTTNQVMLARYHHVRCDECGYETTINIVSHTHCPKCYDKWIARNVPQMHEVAAPPVPEAPKPKPALKGQLRYAKVVLEPINPLFRIIKFEDDGSEGRLHVHFKTPSLRHVQLIVKPNPDERQGGWVISREQPSL